MRLLLPLLRNVVVALGLARGVVWWMTVTVFPLARAQLGELAWVALAGLALEIAAVALVLVPLTAPLRRALEPTAGEADGPRVAWSAHRIPPLTSATTLLAGLASTALGVALMRRQAIGDDLALAAAGVGAAGAILAAMATYTLASSSTSRALAHLGHRSGAPGAGLVHGTVRGKILAVAFGLNTIGLLLFGATGYVRYRADTDLEYLAAAERAQRSAIASQVGDDRAQAEQVWRVTAAPTALLDASGGLVVRFGGEVPFARARPAPGIVASDLGWLVSARLPGGGLVASWLPEEPLRERRRAFGLSLASTGLIVYLAAAVLAWMAARAITIPFRTLGRAAERIASGDLTASPPSVSRDEMGQLAADFRRMTQGLTALVVDVREASQGVSSGARETGAIGERVRRGALGQHEGVVSVQAAVEAMEGSMAQVSRGVGSLSEYVQVTTRAVAENASALEAARQHGAELDRAMEGAMADVDRLAGAGREAEGTLGELESLAGHAVGTLAGVKATVAGLERAAAESEVNAALVAEMAERSGGVVEETVHGIETLRAAVSDAHRRVTALGRRSDDIDQVVDFISEVAGRTNLLSLNASIIAAQAGEHGKAFAVVADQIRDLAAQIARSTKSIGDIIHAVREDVEATAALIDRGDALAVEGVQLARNSLEALGQIQRTTAQGRETAAAIRVAVEAHAGSSRDVSLVVESVANGSRAVTAAVQLVGRSVAGVGSMSRSVNSLATQMSRALDEQAGLGRRQSESLTRLERMIGDITRAVDNHDAATRHVREALGHLSQATGDHEGAVEGLSGVAEQLGTRARTLTERIDRFKVSPA